MYGTDISGIVESPATKVGYAARMVPTEVMAQVLPMEDAPQVGDLVLGRVRNVGRNKRLEVQGGYTMDLFKGDYIVGSFGNRYATGQFEGYVPNGPVTECDLYSAGGVMGETASRHASMAAPTRIEVLGVITDAEGNQINQRDFGMVANDIGTLAPASDNDPEIVLVVGSSMDSGKTTTAATIVRSLTRAGFKVGAAKVTGTATGKDCRLFESSGANPVYDFISAGYPSTYMVEDWELEKIYTSIVDNLKASGVDYIVLEIADGIFQRETSMLLESDIVREGVHHVFFAAGDALAVGYGANAVRAMGLPLRATSGVVTASELGVREAEELTDLPCMSMNRILTDELLCVMECNDVCSLDIHPHRDSTSGTRGENARFPVSA